MSSTLKKDLQLIELTLAAVLRRLKKSDTGNNQMRLSSDNSATYEFSQDVAEAYPQHCGKFVRVAWIKRQREGKGYVLYSQVNALEIKEKPSLSVMAFVWDKSNAGMLVKEYLALCAIELDRAEKPETYTVLYFQVDRERTVTLGLDEEEASEGVFLMDPRYLETSGETKLVKKEYSPGQTGGVKPRRTA